MLWLPFQRALEARRERERERVGRRERDANRSREGGGREVVFVCVRGGLRAKESRRRNS